MAKAGAEKRADVLQVTEGGIRQKVKRWRREARQVEGFGKGKVMSWARRPGHELLPTQDKQRGPPSVALQDRKGRRP